MFKKLDRRQYWLNGRKAEIAVEGCFWAAIEQLARRQARSVTELLEEIDEKRRGREICVAVREFLIKHAS